MSLICKLRNSIGLLFVFTLMINENIYGQLIYPDAVPLSDEQITVNGQTYTAKAWVICSGDQLKLKPDIPYDSNHCYDWLTGTIDNYQTPILGCIVLGYEVKPCEESGIYLVTVRDKTTQNIIGTYCFVVYVIEGMKINEANDIRECMDEHSEIQVNGELIGKGSNRVTTMHEYIHVLYNIGCCTYFKTKVKINKGKFQCTPVKIPMNNYNLSKFQISSPYKYVMYIDALWQGLGFCSSNRLEIEVLTLYIEEYKHMKAPNNWMVVIGDPIHYKIGNAQFFNNFQWSTTHWIYENSISNTSVGTLLIDKNKIPSNTQNDSYGTTNGIVKLTARHKNGKDFTGVANFKMPLSKFRVIGNPIKAKVFYHKDEYIPNQVRSLPEFNWLHYWYQSHTFSFHSNVVDVKSRNGINSGHYGDFIPQYVVEGLNEGIIYIEEIASKQLSIKDFKDYTGIWAYFSTALHENEHAIIWDDNWGNTGYFKNLDTDGDLYSDKWELKHTSDGFQVRNYIDLKDKYDINNLTSNGTTYEEVNAILKQILSPYTKNKLAENDWSYDQFNLFQGKQWK